MGSWCESIRSMLSAKRKSLVDGRNLIFSISLKNMRKRRSHRMDPWGTPEVILV